MQQALIDLINGDRVFAGAAVSAVAPSVDRDGDHAVGVDLSARFGEGSLSRAVVTITGSPAPAGIEMRLARPSAMAVRFPRTRGDRP